MMNDVEFYVPLDKALEASEATSDKNVLQIEVLKTGAWKTSKGTFTLSANDLKEYADNVLKDVRPHSSRVGLPVDEEHDKKAAMAWLKHPRVEANDKGGHTLMMDAELTGSGAPKIRDRTYQFFSPEVHFVHDDPEGTFPRLRNVLMGGAFTNRPLFKGLAAVSALAASDGTSDPDNVIYLNANDKEPSVDLSSIRGKKNEEVTAEERKVLDAAKDQLTNDERKRFYPELSASETDEQKKAREDAEAKKKADDEAAKKKLQANEDGSVTLSASELEELQTNAKAGLEASEKLKRNDAEREVTEMCFSESAGPKLPTDMKPEMTDLWLNASEAEKTTLKKVFEKAKPLLDANDSRENGTGAGGGQGDAASLLDDKIAEMQASEAYKGKSYSQVLKAARDQNPDLAKEADAEDSRQMAAVGTR